jgi:hypothetical protein
MVDAGWLVFFGLMATVAAGVFVIVRSLKHREQMLELAHRERMAMIDKGLVPSPETDPGHVAWTPPGRPQYSSGGPSLHDVSSSHRSMTLGIVIVAIGLGFMSIIGVAARTPDVALGIGGAIMIVGLAFIVISLTKRMSPTREPGMQPPHSPRPPLPVERPPDQIHPSV